MGPKGDGRINTMCKIEEEIKANEENNTQIASNAKKNKECLDDFGKGELSDRYELEGKLVEIKEQLEGLEAEKETWKEEKKEMEYERDELYENTISKEANIESLKEEITFVREALEEEKLEKEVIEEALTEMQWLLKER